MTIVYREHRECPKCGRRYPGLEWTGRNYQCLYLDCSAFFSLEQIKAFDLQRELEYFEEFGTWL